MASSRLGSAIARLQSLSLSTPMALRPMAKPSPTTTTTMTLQTSHSRPLSTTSPLAGAVKKIPPKAKGGLVAAGRAKPTLARRSQRGEDGKKARDPRITNLLAGLRTTYRMPPPLRMARNRHLRHWTIHRAWMLHRRRQRESREGALMRQFQGMQVACEELRNTAGPGLRDTGYLYRVAMEKKGVYGLHGVPIEYARPLTETPARDGWNHGWKR